MITDRSGSMAPLAGDVRAGHNAYLDSLAGEDVTISHMLFSNNNPVWLDRNVPIAQATRLDETNYWGRGATALLDSVMHALVQFRLAEGERGIVFIQTDGQENSSTHFTRKDVEEAIEALTADGRCVVIYAAAGFDAWAERGSFGTGSVLRAATSEGTRASYDSYVVGTQSVLRAAAKGQALDSATVATEMQATLDASDAE